jgi:hypothetical protein
MRDDDFIDLLKKVTIEVRVRQSDHMGEDLLHLNCPFCAPLGRLLKACDDAAEAVATYQSCDAVKGTK